MMSVGSKASCLLMVLKHDEEVMKSHDDQKKQSSISAVTNRHVFGVKIKNLIQAANLSFLFPTLVINRFCLIIRRNVQNLREHNL